MGVGTGEIAASNGERSPQMDVIVYDAINSPVIHRSESGGIIVPWKACTPSWRSPGT
jgi:hypothetical protein